MSGYGVAHYILWQLNSDSFVVDMDFVQVPGGLIFEVDRTQIWTCSTRKIVLASGRLENSFICATVVWAFLASIEPFIHRLNSIVWSLSS